MPDSEKKRPWAKVYESDGVWYVQYAVRKGLYQITSLDAETLDDAKYEASNLTDIPVEDIEVE